MIDVIRHHADNQSHVPYTVTWNIEKSIGCSLFIFLFWPYVTSWGDASCASEPLSIFTSLYVYVKRKLFVATVALEFFSFSFAVNQIRFYLIRSIGETQKIKFCQMDATQTHKQIHFLLYSTIIIMIFPAICCPLAEHSSSTSNIMFMCSALPMRPWVHESMSPWWKHRTHELFVIIYLIKQYFSDILYLIFYFHCSTHHFTLSSCIDDDGKIYNSLLSLSSQRNNQFHYMKLNWWLIVIPIYP